MGIRFSRIILFNLFAVALTMFGCDDNGGLSKICPQPIPCGISQAGNIVTNVEQKGYSMYEVGECKFGTLRCDEEGNEYCDGFIAPSDEVCDFKDNNCDGQIDEDFDLDQDGETSCAGDCDDNDAYIHTSIQEICNNIDDNCNGVIDENVYKTCWNGGHTGIRNSPPSICKSGTSSCTAGRWNSCVGEVIPTQEICDNLDNDCDGQVDERVTNSCGISNVGQCTRGDRICAGNEQLCVDAVYPSGEVCDSVDNDCDGDIDEGIYQPCSTACGEGIETCSSGQWVSCTAPEPEIELCDGVDNDCDGELDEGCACIDGQVTLCRSNIIDRSSGAPVTCGVGVKMCDEHGMWGPCYFFSAEPEQCNNWDDDCDGNIDGQTESCGDPNTAGIGVCRLGEKTCNAGVWSMCHGDVAPQSEICDQLDNDCDGLVDENLNPHTKVDMIFAIDISGSMCGSINALIQGIGAYIVDFAGTEHRFGIVTFPGVSPMAGTVRTNPSLLPATHFQNVLSQITCNGGGWEPSYDVAQMLSDPADPFNIGWRSDAYPYIIIISDEQAQTWTGLTQTHIAPQMVNCMIGECVSGDSIEIFIIGPNYAATQWSQVTYNDPARFINIYPIDSNRYTQFFRNVFEDICI